MFSLLIKPAGPDCNINCEYCFYSCKASMFGLNKHRMSDQIQEKLVRDYLALDFPISSFAWQGGEPTLMGLDFYRRLIDLQSEYGKPGHYISNSLQTNAILLDDEWCQFLHDHNWLIGISLDGPKEYHDAYRIDHSGQGTFDRVMSSIRRCKDHRVQFNVLTLLNDKNVQHPDDLFDFFIEHNIKYLQFVPCVEIDPATNKLASFSITPQQYGDFLCRILHRQIEYGISKVSVRITDSLVNYLLHGRHTDCTFMKSCSDYIVIEHQGDAFCCDFFVQDEYRLGNIMETPIGDLANSEIKRNFARLKKQLHNKCLICRYCDMCRGGCLKDRLPLNDGFKVPSYLCPAYKQFFDYAVPKLRQILAERKLYR